MIRQLKDIIGNTPISVYDIETMRYGRREQLYSAAMYRDGQKPVEKFFKLPDKFINEANFRSRTFLERSGYKTAEKAAEYRNIPQRSSVLSSLFSDVSKGNHLLIGHNLRFDLSNTLRTMSADDSNALVSAFGAINKRAASTLGRPQTVSNLIQKGFGRKAYTEYSRGIREALASGKTAVADTLTLSQILLAGATERKDLGFDFSKDMFSGLKLGFIKRFFDAEQKGGHTGTADTISTRKLFSWLDEVALPQILDPNRAPDESVHGFLNYIKNIQDSGWSHIQKRSKVAGLALDYVDKGFVSYEKGGKYKTLSGDVKSKDVFNLIGGEKYSGFTAEEFEKEWSANVNSLNAAKKIDPEWKTNAEQLQSSIFYHDEEKYFNKYKESLFKKSAYQAGHETAFKSGAEEIARRNKFLVGTGLALGAFALFNMAKISGKDDDYNTIEGMRHGGVAEKNRHELTDFGSGWNPLKGLTRASETLADMIQSSAFQTALKNASEVEYIGSGSFGVVHKMKGSFRGKDFYFARKVGEVDKLEAAALSEMGESIAPTLYSFDPKANTIDMEFFEGQSLNKIPWLENKSGIVNRILNHADKEINSKGWQHHDLFERNVMIVNTPNGDEVGVVDWGLASKRISGKDDAYNTIEGLRHGGIAQKLRLENTDFGSGWRGILKAASMEFLNSLKQYSHIAGAAAIPGFAYGYHKGKEEGKVSITKFAGAMALDMTDDVFIFGGPSIVKKFPKIEKEFKSVTNVLEKPLSKKIGVGFFGFTVGKLAGEVVGKIVGKNDAYNPIEGLRHGGVAEQMRRTYTDFGSPWVGMLLGNSLGVAMKMARKALSIKNVPRSFLSEMGLSGLRTIEKTELGEAGAYLFVDKKAVANELAKIGHTNVNKDFYKVVIGHEISELFHAERLAKNKPGTLIRPKYGSHLSPAVIAEEAIHAKSMGDKVFQEMREVRSKELDLMKSLLESNPPAPGTAEFNSMNAYLKRPPTAIYDNVEKKWESISKKYNLNKISGKDDAYNTIEGLHPEGKLGGIGSWAKKMIQKYTDFGSGYRGPVAPVHHPEINPEYNRAEDVYRYESMRASKIGASEEELYKWATQKDKEPSAYVEASASAGTALHQLMQAQMLQKGEVSKVEDLTYSNGISGHIDIRGPKGIGDIKTVDEGIFNAIVKSGQPKPMHKSQVMFYLGSEGEEQGYIQYVNRQKPWQQKTFFFQFNPYQYEQLLRKADRVRSRIEAEIEAGKLIKNNLPRTASLQRLIEDSRKSPSNSQQIENISEYKQVFNEEMAYLNGIKRGMPKSGEARQRIEKSKRDRAMQSTQGMGLELFNSRNNHHIM